MPGMRKVLIVGGGFSGLCCGRDLASHFLVTIVDAKEFFEYTPGVLRAYVKPKHLDALTFCLQPVIESSMGCKFIWGEVKKLSNNRTATIKPMFTNQEEVIDFDYCIIAAGCNFGMFHEYGESLWFSTIHQKARENSSWPHLDERFLEGRRRHILEEYGHIQRLEAEEKEVLVVGAGFIGVEWVTELQYYFPKLKLTIIDGLDQCLGPLPPKAAAYCQKYMEKKKIRCFFGLEYFYNKGSADFWDSMAVCQEDRTRHKFRYHRDIEKELAGKSKEEIDAAKKKPQEGTFTSYRPDEKKETYVCVGVKSSNKFFMPEETLSTGGVGGGAWILIEKNLAVMTRDGEMWCTDQNDGGPTDEKWGGCCKRDKQGTPCGNPRIFAIGDCNYGCVEPYSTEGEWAGKGTMFQDRDGNPMKPLSKDEAKAEAAKRKKEEEANGNSIKPPQIPYGEWPIPPIPKISYPGEEQSIIACRNIEKIDHLVYSTRKRECCGHGLKCGVQCCSCPPCQGLGTFCYNMINGSPMEVHDMHWPWGAGMFATSLGPDDACFVIAANWEKQSGCMVNWGQLASVQKEIIEASKVNEGRYGILGRLIWHFVHHTPVHLWGGGPRFGY